MQQRSRTLLGVAVFTALAMPAMAQPGGGAGGRQGGAPPTPEQFVERMMQNDANGDGKLSADELPGRFAERMFESGDANGDGFLDKAELTEVASNFGQRGGGFGGRGGQGAEGGRPGAPIGATPGAQGRPGVGVAGAPGEMTFDRGMQQAGRAMRQLRRSAFDDASRAGDLRLIQDIQSGLVAAKAQAARVPMAPQAKEHYGDDEVKYQSDIRLQLIQGIMESLALEAAVIEGDTTGAKESLQHLLEAQKMGHDAFQPEEDEANERSPQTLPEPIRVRPGDPQRAPGGRPGGRPGGSGG